MSNGPNNSDNEADDEQATKTLTVMGWAELAPSGTVTVPANTGIDDIPDEDLMECLREDLRDRGFTEQQIEEEIRIEVDECEWKP